MVGRCHSEWEKGGVVERCDYEEKRFGEPAGPGVEAV